MGPWRAPRRAGRGRRLRAGTGGVSLVELLSEWLPPLHRSLLQGSAPIRGIHVRDRLRERPAMPARVGRGVLALAVWPVGRLADDCRPGRLGLRAVSVCVLDAHEHVRRACLSLDHDHGAVLVDELRPVVADLESLPEPERAAEPLGRLAHVAVRQLGMTVASGTERFVFTIELLYTRSRWVSLNAVGYLSP